MLFCIWVKYAYAGAGNVRKALQGSLAGIAGGGHEYGDFIVYALLFGYPMMLSPVLI